MKFFIDFHMKSIAVVCFFLTIYTTPSIGIKADSLPYPGISAEQDSIARTIVYHIHSFQWKTADKEFRYLRRLEHKQNLPPLSYLVMIASNVMRIQNNEYQDSKQKERIRKEINEYAKDALTIINKKSANSTDSAVATYQFIQGGITGFVATLDIQSNPFESLTDALKALQILEEVSKANPSIKDVYLGLGIFHCTVAKAPFLVKSALKAFGRTVNLDSGLAYIRWSVYNGRYTKTIAAQYLLLFLNPYLGDQMQEKGKLFLALEKEYPKNPYYFFLEMEDAVCFTPSKFFSLTNRQRFENTFKEFITDDYSLKRYQQLLRWQYLLLNPFPDKHMAPDKNFNLRAFAYYPYFITAIREKYLLTSPYLFNNDTEKSRTVMLKDIGSHAADILEESDMGQSWKGFFAWHIRDALKIK